MSLENRALTWALRRWIKPRSRLEKYQDLETSRGLTAWVPIPPKLPRGWHIRRARDPGLCGEWIEPEAPDHPARRRCILYFHGGGYVSMSSRTHRSLTSRLAAAGHASLFALDYRLAPEHPFPAAFDDAIGAYHAVIAAGIEPRHIALGGDSAGGGLALATALGLRADHSPMPAAVILFSPWTDLAATGESLMMNDATDALMHGIKVAEWAKLYLRDTPATDPRASPLYADFAGSPPLFVQVGGDEILLDDSRRLFAKAKQAGVEVTLQIWRDVPHGWQIFGPILPEARAALRQAGMFIADKLA